jgi:hypothetical protein
VGLRAVNKSGEKYNPGLAKRRALFPEGRGLGVGGRKREKKKVKEKRKINPPSAVLTLTHKYFGVAEKT